MTPGVKEGVKSKCLPVMGRIGTVVPTRKGADLLLVFHSKEGRYTCERMLFNDAKRREAYGQGIVNRLQTPIAKANDSVAALHRVVKCASRMR